MGRVSSSEVVPRDPTGLMWDQRVRRAQFLAERYPASRDILIFYRGLAEWQKEVSSRVSALSDLEKMFPSLLDLVARTGPPVLAQASRDLDSSDVDGLITDCWESSNDFSTLEFFARALLQPYVTGLRAGVDCPWCSQPPQVGCLRSQGEGLGLDLVCPLCLCRRGFPRTRCPGCDESSEKNLATYTAPDFPHLRVKPCDTCRAYFRAATGPLGVPERLP